MSQTMLMKALPALILLLCGAGVTARRPHIIFIVADDLGWNDVSFHGSDQIPTPNIDALAYSGVILNNYYVQPICTPSRGALMSGLHPIHTGLQHGVIMGNAPYGLPLWVKTLPERLNQLGYESHAVGKWHLGFYYREFTPTFRGFKSHYGYWTGHKDYYDHTAQEGDNWGYDMRNGMKVARDAFGFYSTDLFTDRATTIISDHNSSRPLFLYLAHLAVHSANPYSLLQAPPEAVNKFPYVKGARKKFAGMVSCLDDSVGKVVKALEMKGMLQDSIIVFSTDNGGPAAGFDGNAASNWPLRGVKNTLWEGGVRGSSFVWQPYALKPRVASQLMTIEDWMPTLFTAAGGNASSLTGLDGMDMWRSLAKDGSSPRSQLLHNIDDIYGNSALRIGDWKLLRGKWLPCLPSMGSWFVAVHEICFLSYYENDGLAEEEYRTSYGGEWDGWYGPSGRSNSSTGIPPYNVSMVLNSPAALALQSMGIKLSKKWILQTRKVATVDCGPKPSPPTPCNPLKELCLYNVAKDPCEMNNLAQNYPERVKLLLQQLAEYNSTALSPANVKGDPRGNPKNWGYEWTNWMDQL